MQESEKKRLLVIITDDLSALIRKGEIIDRYYNPANYFDEVELLTICDCQAPELDLLQKTVGKAKLYLTIIRRPSLIRTFGWNRHLLKGWLKSTIKEIKIKPDLIRIHRIHLNGVVGAEVKKKFQVPMIASLHGVGDLNNKLEVTACRNLLKKIFIYLYGRQCLRLAKYGIKYCDEVICVYKSIIEYAKRLGFDNPRLLYNAVSDRIPQKDTYAIQSPPPRLVYVGRLTRGIKEPSNIMKAIAGLDVRLDIIGDGPMRNELLRLAEKLGISHKVTFSRFMPNKDVIKSLRLYDIFLYQYYSWEISKSVIEAAFCGLPIILNRLEGNPVPEFLDADYLITGPNEPEQYRQAIETLIEDRDKREYYGKAARQ